MKMYYWDTSAIIKRYHSEKGSKKVNNLFEEMAQGESKGIISYLCVLESLSAIVRRKSEIRGDYKKVIKTMLMEYVDRFTIIPVDSDIMALSMKAVLKHGLKSLDAIHLGTLLYISSYLNQEIILISSDKELLHAAKNEGFEILNPEE